MPWVMPVAVFARNRRSIWNAKIDPDGDPWLAGALWRCMSRVGGLRCATVVLCFSRPSEAATNSAWTCSVH